MKFSLKNSLIAFKNFLKSVNCCSSSCMNQTIQALDEENLKIIQELQEQVAGLVATINDLKGSHVSTYI